MSTNANSSSLAGAYLVNGTVGNVGMPGAPIMHFSLVVVPGTNSVNGTVEITQATAPPYNQIVVHNVSGAIHAIGFGSVIQIVVLNGQSTQSVSTPAFATYLAQFSAHMAIDSNWNGQGGFIYGTQRVENVPVKKS